MSSDERYPHETEPEHDFLRRIVKVLSDQNTRSALNAVIARELIEERLNPEYARLNRDQFYEDQVWGK